jgi:tRNA(Ile)-lysidine synthase
MPAAEPWIERIERRIKRWCGRAKLGRAWVVAVSGGGDSVALLRLLHRIAPKIGLKLSAAHLNHGARGEASRADAVFVAELAASLQLPCDIGKWRPVRPAHFEADARRARYAYLIEAARAREASVVAVAHTSDDQAETILHRIVRGTGLRGLAGMPWRRNLALVPQITLVRPLLDVSRRALREYLGDMGQPFHEDETNADMQKTRARIRHDLLPRLAAEYNPRVTEALVRLGAHAAALQRSLDADLDELERAAVSKKEADCVVLKRECLDSLPAFLRCEVLRRVWRLAGWPEQGMTARRWWRLAALVRREETPKVAIGAGVVASADGNFLVLGRSASGA